ncbi:MAG: DUF3795 domain-containing protein, partial [Candidatus Hodarchaeota archaeon]
RAYCGLICTDCGAYLSKLNNDDALRKKTADRWSSPEWKVEPHEINCDGCKSDGTHFKHCNICTVRACASERGVETCAHCDDYGCDTLEGFLNILGGNLRDNLEKLRSSL